METTEKRLTEWLRDAHAMEKHATTMLDALAKRIENYQTSKRKFNAISKKHGNRQPRCRSMSSGAVKARPLGKNSAGQSVAMGHGLGGAFVGDKLIKRAITEISCYNIKLPQPLLSETARRVQLVKTFCVKKRRWGVGSRITSLAQQRRISIAKRRPAAKHRRFSSHKDDGVGRGSLRS